MHSGEQMTSSNLVLARTRAGHVTSVLPADATWPENATTGHEQIVGFNDAMIDLTSLLPDAELDILHDKAVSAGIVSLYALVIVVGSVGSLLVIVSIARSRLMWTATNVFIANLALTDLFVCAIDLPMTLHYQLTNDWVFGNAMCHVVMTTFGIVVFSSAINLALIAVDRYVLIVCPLRRRMSVSVAVAAVVATGVVAAGASAPIAVYTKHIRSRDVAPDIPWDTSYCTEEWPTVSARQLYTVSAFVFQFAVPLVVIALLYYRIFRRLRARPVPGNGSSGGGRTRAAAAAARQSSPVRTAVIATDASLAADEGYSVSMATISPAVASRQGNRPRHGGGTASQRGGSRRRARTNKMLVAVVVVFGITWTPFHLFEIVLEFGLDVFAGRYLRLISLAFRAVAFSSACVNPFLYGWMNDNYRTSFLTIVAPIIHRLPRVRSVDGRQRPDQQACRPLRESENQPGISIALHQRLPTTRSSFYNDNDDMQKTAISDVDATGAGYGSSNGHTTVNTGVCCVDKSGFLCVATDPMKPVTDKGNSLNLCGCDGTATDVDNQLPTYDVVVSSVGNNDNAAATTTASMSEKTVLTTSDDCQFHLAVDIGLLETEIADP